MSAAFVKVGPDFCLKCSNTFETLSVDNKQKADAFDAMLANRLAEIQVQERAVHLKTLNYYQSGRWKLDFDQIIKPFKTHVVVKKRFLWIKPITKETISYGFLLQNVGHVVGKLKACNLDFWETLLPYPTTYKNYESVRTALFKTLIAIYEGETFHEKFPPELTKSPLLPYIYRRAVTDYERRILRSGYDLEISRSEKPTLHKVEILRKYINVNGVDCFVPIHEYNQILNLISIADEIANKNI